MVISNLPEDLVYAIAAKTSEFETPYDRLFPIYSMSSVCRAWRTALSSLLFRDLRIRGGTGHKFLQFLDTDRGEEVAAHVLGVHVEETFLECALIFLSGMLLKLPYLQRLEVHIFKFSLPCDDSSHTTLERLLPHLSSTKAPLRSFKIRLPSFRDTDTYHKLITMLNLFSSIEELRISFSNDCFEGPRLQAHAQIGESLARAGNIVLPHVQIASLAIESWSITNPIPILFRGIQLGGTVSSLRSVDLATSCLQSFGAMCELVADVGPSVLSLTCTIPTLPPGRNSDRKSVSLTCDDED